MYEQFFGLREVPFTLAPDTHYFFCHRGHQEAINVLMFATSSGEGFVKITGEVGTGKTLLCREFLNRLGDDYQTAYIPNPFLSPSSLYKSLADELDIPTKNTSDYELLKLINDYLLELSKAGRRVVVCLDESQSIPDQTLEALRLLSNLETEKRKLLQIVLFGQPELDEKLSKPRNRQLRQRIVYSYQLKPLDHTRVASYLDHRLRAAGYNGDTLFAKGAIEYIYKASGGIPRLINIISNKSLLLAFGRGERAIGVKHVQAAILDTEGVRVSNHFIENFFYWGTGLGSFLLVGTVYWFLGKIL